MFSFFGKKKNSPDEETETPPIPGPREDDFVVIEQRPAGPAGGLYPSIGGGYPYPPRPAPAPPAPQVQTAKETSFHYLQGVPFQLSKDLQLCSNKDAFVIQIGDVLAFSARKLNLDNFNYDFSVEKSVLKECTL